MKKYLNSNLFYQGDANIFLPLCMVYVSSFILTLMGANGYFNWEINNYLYNQMQMRFVFSYDLVLLLIAYIGIIYVIIVGIFKRKKWSTFLSGPFSRMDIRKRELIIIVISVIIYIAIYLSVIAKNYIQYYDVLTYITDFKIIVLLDIVRIISISTITIGVLSILDSVFANIYYLAAAVVITFIYLIFLLVNFGSLLNYYVYGEVYGLDYVYNGLIEYISGTSIGNSITALQIVFMSSIFIIIGIVLIFISKILTNKMLVENMNEGIIFSFPKKVASFMIVTFSGVVSAPYISSLINDIYFKYTLGVYELVIIKAISIVVVSVISYYVFRNFIKIKKDVYY